MNFFTYYKNSLNMIKLVSPIFETNKHIKYILGDQNEKSSLRITRFILQGCE